MNFDKEPMVKIPSKEKATIEKLVKRLEFSAKEKKILMNDLKTISKIYSK